MKWIKCSDRLPKANSDVKIKLNNKTIKAFFAHFTGDIGSYAGWGYCYENGNKFIPFTEIDKWMPLPDGDNDEEQ